MSGQVAALVSFKRTTPWFLIVSSILVSNVPRIFIPSLLLGDLALRKLHEIDVTVSMPYFTDVETGAPRN